MKTTVATALLTFFLFTVASPPNEASQSNPSTMTNPTSELFMRESVRFSCQTAECAGYLYIPKGEMPLAKIPAIAMAPGIGSLKEMGLLPYAEAFVKNGFAVLLFDYRHWGESGGQPREQAIPQTQIDDYRHTLTYLSTRPEIDEKRLAIWGSSFSGGHVLQVAALDERVKVIVSQTPPTDLHALVRSRGDAETQQQMFTAFANERKRLALEKTHRYIPIAERGKANDAMMDTDTFNFQEKMQQHYAPHFINRMSVDSLEAIYEYAPLLWIPRIRNKPLLVINATQDQIVDPNSVRQAFSLASQPKKLHEIATGHYGVYEGQHLLDAINAAVGWFKQYL